MEYMTSFRESSVSNLLKSSMDLIVQSLGNLMLMFKFQVSGIGADDSR